MDLLLMNTQKLFYISSPMCLWKEQCNLMRNCQLIQLYLGQILWTIWFISYEILVGSLWIIYEIWSVDLFFKPKVYVRRMAQFDKKLPIWSWGYSQNIFILWFLAYEASMNVQYIPSLYTIILRWYNNFDGIWVHCQQFQVVFS